VRGALAALEKSVEEGELGAVTGAVPTIGQITVGCALGYLDFRYQSEEWHTRNRRLAAWYTDFAQRKSMQLTVPRA
jgi:glutathione S-transferase